MFANPNPTPFAGANMFNNVFNQNKPGDNTPTVTTNLFNSNTTVNDKKADDKPKTSHFDSN